MAETKDNTSDSTGASKDSSKKSFAQFLAESDIQPIAFLGKCMQFFGMKATISFFLGAASFYGYGLFKHIPGINPKEKEIELSGMVQTLDGEPLDDQSAREAIPLLYGKDHGQTHSARLHNQLVSERLAPKLA